MFGEVLMDLIQPTIMTRIIDEGILGAGNQGNSDLTLIIILGILILVMLFQTISKGVASWERIKEVLDEKPEIVDGSEDILSGKVRKYSRKRQQLLGALNGSVEEMITGYRTVVAYNRQERIADQFCETADALTKAGIHTDIFSGVMGPIMNCIGNIGFVIIAVFGGYFATKDLISVGIISAFIVYFKHVDFSYKKGTPVLRDFNLEIPSEKKVALVGATGSGKTTVANLLMRFYDIEKGKILINGQDIRHISRESLRKNLAIVLQDTVLFSDTICNNLKYGNENVSERQLEQAIAMSNCGEMIKSMPKGLDTILTGAGTEISQGQRQLLAIARVFVADPKILILDEATSNVDTRTEKVIQNAMHQIMKSRTSIIIAHRLSTIRDADRIIVMDHGQVVEQGSHEELMKKKGKYYNLYMTQYAGIAI